MPRESPVPPVDVPKFIPVVLVPKPVPKAGVAPKPVVPLKLGVPKAPVPKRPGLAAVEAVALRRAGAPLVSVKCYVHVGSQLPSV